MCVHVNANGWPRRAVRYKLYFPCRDFSLPVLTSSVTSVIENNEGGIYDLSHGTVRLQIFGKEIGE